ncbi:L-serine ammonia-lyase, iron-sulfur-dependent, subunit beta [Bacillus thuringiensis]
MRYNSVFDIIGPVMIGSPNPYQVEAVKTGQLARKIFEHEPEKIEISLYGGLKKANQYFELNAAFVGGILGFEINNPLIINALSIAKEKGIIINCYEESAKFPQQNVTKINLYKEKNKIEIITCLTGWGKIDLLEVNGFKLKRKETDPALLIINNDHFYTLSSITSLLTRNKINVNMMRISKKQQEQSSLIILETDKLLSYELINAIQSMPHIYQAIILD